MTNEFGYDPEKYSNLQREALDLLKGKPIGDLPPQISTLLADYLSQAEALDAKHLISPTDSVEIIVSHDRTVITIIENESDNNQSGDKKNQLKSYYIIDTKSGKFVDILAWFSISMQKHSRQAEAFRVGATSSSGGSNTEKATIGVGLIRDTPLRRKAAKVFYGTENLGVIGHLTAFHEIAHSFQRIPLSDGKKTANHSTVYQFTLGVLIAINLVTPFLSDYLSTHRNFVSMIERNAHAFALSAVRKLKAEGVDITRGMKPKELNGIVERVLAESELAFIGVPGEKIKSRRNPLSRRIKQKLSALFS